jgi:ketosteroid isomerase-like protein
VRSHASVELDRDRSREDPRPLHSALLSDLARRVGALEARVDALADREAIRELAAAYCRAVAGSDVENVVGLFCADGVFETAAIPTLDRPAGRIAGRDEIRSEYGATVSVIAPKPFIHNHVVEIDEAGSRASGFCSVEIRTVQDGTAYNVAGHYEDTYRREDGAWKFERRRFVVYYWTPATEGWA